LISVTCCYIKRYAIITIVTLIYVISIGYRDSQHKGHTLNVEIKNAGRRGQHK
jgi:hypothetical protein